MGLVGEAEEGMGGVVLVGGEEGSVVEIGVGLEAHHLWETGGEGKGRREADSVGAGSVEADSEEVEDVGTRCRTASKQKAACAQCLERCPVPWWHLQCNRTSILDTWKRIYWHHLAFLEDSEPATASRIC